MKDSIDFGSMEISTFFRKLLIPTVLGMVFSAIFVITDGIFVGKGRGGFDYLVCIGRRSSFLCLGVCRQWLFIDKYRSHVRQCGLLYLPHSPEPTLRFFHRTR